MAKDTDKTVDPAYARSLERERWDSKPMLHERYSRVANRELYRERLGEIFGERNHQTGERYHKVYASPARLAEIERKKRVAKQLEENESKG